MFEITPKLLAGFLISFIVIWVVAYIVSVISLFRTRSPSDLRAQREEQDREINAGWRIALIPIDDDTKPIPASKVGTLLVGPIVLMFLVGALLEVFDSGASYLPGILIVGSLVAGGTLIFFRRSAGKRFRAAWIDVPGRCVDHEIRNMDVDNQPVWMCRLVCEINQGGQSYRLTPNVNWSHAMARDGHFASEEKAQDFLQSRISPGGDCRLRVNPKNPLQGELS